MARSYRFGQTKTVTVHHLVVSNAALLNIDRLMIQKHNAKRSIAIAVLPSLEFAYHPSINMEKQEQEQEQQQQV
jgi:SNF2 family DNA or RNA helicase